MATFLETERLVLRRFTPADEDDVAALHSDPAVMRHLGRPATRAEIHDDVMPRLLACYERFGGLGYWPAIEKATSAFLGWFVFRPPTDPGPGEVELGYRLHTAAWGRGFATEGSRALVAKGFAELGVRRVMATTRVANTGSRRVLEKVGLRLVRTFQQEQRDEPEVEYALTAEEWRRTPSAPAPGPSSATPPR